MTEPASAVGAVGGSTAALEARVLGAVQQLARETGGRRAEHAVALDASLEREVGLGSLERVELVARLEAALGRPLDERYLRLDTPRQLALALAEPSQPGEPAAAPAERARPAPGLAAASRLPGAARTLHEVLWRRAEAEPERPHVFMREEDGREHTVGYGGLLEEARALAGGLREHGVAKSDTVALMLPTGGDFLRTFMGILLAGAVPVPIYPPIRLDQLEEYALRQAAILADAGAGMLVTVPRARPVASLLAARAPKLRSVVTAEELSERGARWDAPDGEGDDPAFIQYTSGSTGQPKGVLLSHANLLANIRAIGHGLEARPADVGVSWLPLYHDMGLIGSWLFCMHEGFPIDIQSPLSFLSRPERWLWAIHRRRATLSAAPNFAFELCVRRIPDAALDGLDLSSWRCALNGAEPVQPDTLDRFASRFAPYGFRREALQPVYGLAESSVAVCFPPVGRGPRVDRVERRAFEAEGRARPADPEDASALRFVSVGAALPEHEVRIGDETGEPVAERVVGRLLFRGPSASAGYFGQPEATAAITAKEGFLDSGDLAYLADGEVFVTGRRKDLIIKGGRNLVPQEIEEIAASVEGVRKGCVVAIGVADAATGTESLVVVAETRAVGAAEREAMATAVTERVAQGVGLPPDRVVLVPPGSVPKTSSGKIRRAATRDLLASGVLGRPTRAALGIKARLLASAAFHAARLGLRALGRAVYAAGLAGALAPPLAAAWALAGVLPRRGVAALERLYCRYALRVAGLRATIEGREHLAPATPCVLVCNHASYADVPVLLALVPGDFAFVAKKEVLGYPVVGTFVRRAGHLTVDRWDALQGKTDASRVAEAIQAGRSVLVFPEGTFTAAAGLRPFRMGAFATAVETGVPVVPMALRGTRRALRDGRLVPRRGRLDLWIGAPLRATGGGFQAAVGLRDRVAEAIASHCGEPRLELVAGGPERSAG